MERQDPTSRIASLIQQYRRNPDAFTPDEIEALRDAAKSVGMKFSGDFNLGQAAKNFGYNLADGLTFGALSGVNNLFDLDWKPAHTNTADDVAGFLGEATGFLAPMGFGGKIASKALGKAEQIVAGRAAGTLAEADMLGSKLASKIGSKGGTAGSSMLDDIVKPFTDRGIGTAAAESAQSGIGSAINKAGEIAGDGAKYINAGQEAIANLMVKNPNLAKAIIQGSVAYGSSDFFEDPLGTPGRMLEGAALGGVGLGLGKTAKYLATKLKISMPEATQLAKAYLVLNKGMDSKRSRYELEAAY